MRVRVLSASHVLSGIVFCWKHDADPFGPWFGQDHCNGRADAYYSRTIAGSWLERRLGVASLPCFRLRAATTAGLASL